VSDFKDYELFIDSLSKQINNFSLNLNPKEFGVIIEVGDGLAKVVGLDEVCLGEVVYYLKDGDDVGIGMVMGIEPNFVHVMLFNKLDLVCAGVEVFSTKHHFRIPVGKHVLGRVINVLGQPVDGAGALVTDETLEYREIEAMAPGIMDRSSVCEPLQTGIKIIDALIPIGLGQKQLILGDRQSGKTALAIDTILNQKAVKDAGGKFTYCIYVAIGKKTSDIAKIYELLRRNGAMEYTIIIASTASDPTSMQYVAPMCGAALAEYFRDKGEAALVIFDDLTKHADAYREISLLMRRTPARGAYPGDIFYLHSRLLERAVKMHEKKGGGSVTMLPMIETQAGDVSDYIPTNVISITDGQVYLDKQLFFDGQKPAIDIGLSVSRIGSAAQYKAMKKIAGRLKGELAQSRELESFARTVSDLDPETMKMLVRGRLLRELFKQSLNRPIGFANMIIILFAGIKGLLDKVKISEPISDFEAKLFTYFSEKHQDIIEFLNTEHSFDDAMEERISAAIKSFLETY